MKDHLLHTRVCLLLGTLGLLWMLVGCRRDVVIFPPEVVPVGEQQITPVCGFYLLNEGNMGSNKSTLDYYDFRSATYSRNIYAFSNPTVPKELGDVGNDLAIYGARLYAVINCSNKIEVMRSSDCLRLGQINIPNCRYLAFDGAYGYVTSYAGPVQLGGHSQIGYVARFDTATLQITDTCYVGYQPDDVAIVGQKMYVANSGGYNVHNYETTLSVIDLHSFTEQYRIHVAVNLHRLQLDHYGQLWVTSRGDYFDNPSRLFVVDTATDQVTDSVDIPVSVMALQGDSLYVISHAFSYETYDYELAFRIVDVRTHQIVCQQFITDGTQSRITKPYGLMVHPVTHDFYVTDAGNYVEPGRLYCYDSQGVLRWSVRTGDIPAHFALLYHK